MNNLYKILVLILLALLCAIVLYTSVKANDTMLKVCPVNAISARNNVAVIDSLKCINCGRCFQGIPSPYNFTLFPNIKPKPAPEAEQSDAMSQKDTAAVPAPGSSQPQSAGTVQKKPLSAEQAQAKAGSPAGIKEKLKTFFIVNPEACIGCQLCVQNCPVNAIKMVNGKAVIDPEKCSACGICANGAGEDFAGCPTSAISKVTEAVKKTK